MRMAAGISFHVKWSHDCIIVTDIAHFPPILTPCTLLTTIVPLFDLIDLVKVIDTTIFLGVPCAEKITRLWRKTAAPQAGKFWDRAAMRSTAEKEAPHARASVRPRASSGETDSVRAADGLQAARPRSVRCWRYSARGHLALALYVRCPERVQELRTATGDLVIVFGFFLDGVMAKPAVGGSPAIRVLRPARVWSITGAPPQRRLCATM